MLNFQKRPPTLAKILYLNCSPILSKYVLISFPPLIFKFTQFFLQLCLQLLIEDRNYKL